MTKYTELLVTPLIIKKEKDNLKFFTRKDFNLFFTKSWFSDKKSSYFKHNKHKILI